MSGFKSNDLTLTTVSNNYTSNGTAGIGDSANRNQIIQGLSGSSVQTSDMGAINAAFDFAEHTRSGVENLIAQQTQSAAKSQSDFLDFAAALKKSADTPSTNNLVIGGMVIAGAAVLLLLWSKM